MANKDELVQSVKNIVKLWRDGKLADAYAGYRNLFSAPDFGEHRPEDQRSALRLMVLAKGAPDPERPTPAMMFALINKHNPTIFYGVPTLFAAMLHDQTLKDMGHRVLGFDDSYQDFGAGQFIWRLDEGQGDVSVRGYAAASDPRRDGQAAGY